MRWLMERYWKWRPHGVVRVPSGPHRTASPCRAAPHPTTRPQRGHDPGITESAPQRLGAHGHPAGSHPPKLQGFPAEGEHPRARPRGQPVDGPRPAGCTAVHTARSAREALLTSVQDRPRPASAGHPPGCPQPHPSQRVLPLPQSISLINPGCHLQVKEGHATSGYLSKNPEQYGTRRLGQMVNRRNEWPGTQKGTWRTSPKEGWRGPSLKSRSARGRRPYSPANAAWPQDGRGEEASGAAPAQPHEPQGKHRPTHLDGVFDEDHSLVQAQIPPGCGACGQREHGR